MGKTIVISESQLNRLIGVVINEVSVLNKNTWVKLSLLNNRQVLISDDGSVSITNNQNKPVRLRFDGKVLFTKIPINVDRMDETPNGLVVTARSGNNATLNREQVKVLISFIDNPSKSEETIENVSVGDKKGTIVARKI